MDPATKAFIDLLLGPLGLTVGLILVAFGFVLNKVQSTKQADSRVAAEKARGDEWKAAHDKQVEVNAQMASALEKNNDAVQAAIRYIDAGARRPGGRTAG